MDIDTDIVPLLIQESVPPGFVLIRNGSIHARVTLADLSLFRRITFTSRSGLSAMDISVQYMDILEHMSIFPITLIGSKRR